MSSCTRLVWVAFIQVRREYAIIRSAFGVKLAGPRQFGVDTKTQNLHLLTEPDFIGPEEEIRVGWVPLPGQDYSLVLVGLESDLPGISPFSDVLHVFI